MASTKFQFKRMAKWGVNLAYKTRVPRKYRAVGLGGSRRRAVGSTRQGRDRWWVIRELGVQNLSLLEPSTKLVMGVMGGMGRNKPEGESGEKTRDTGGMRRKEGKPNEQRLKDEFQTRRRQVMVLQRRYGGYANPSRRLARRVASARQTYGRSLLRASSDPSLTSKASTTSSTTSMVSLLAPLERRLDVALWRSGLRISPRMAHQQCVHGNIRVRLPQTSDFFVVKHPGYVRPVGAVVQVDAKAWSSRSAISRRYWTYRGHPQPVGTGNRGDKGGRPIGQGYRGLAPYLTVDVPSGTFMVTRLPRDGEIRFPATASRTLKHLT